MWSVVYHWLVLATAIVGLVQADDEDYDACKAGIVYHDLIQGIS